jgi:hypothetical protein
MQVKFDVHGTKVGIMTNSHIGRGVVEFEFTLREDEISSVGGVPGAKSIRHADSLVSESDTPRAVGAVRSQTLMLSKSEARAIASALMGAAAEL